MGKYMLKLYVTGRNARSQQAIANLKQICEEDLDNEYELDVIDVTEHPQQAEEHKIFATPTLIKELPPPVRRLIGDLSARRKVLNGLDIVALPT